VDTGSGRKDTEAVAGAVVFQKRSLGGCNSNGNADGDYDAVTVEVSKTALRSSRVYILLYKTVCYLLFRVGGPLTALVLLNSRLLATLRRQKRWRRSRQSVTASRVPAWRRENVTAMLWSRDRHARHRGNGVHHLRAARPVPATRLRRRQLDL